MRYLPDDVDDVPPRKPSATIKDWRSSYRNDFRSPALDMGVFKRGDWWWMDARAHGHQYREPLGTTTGERPSVFCDQLDLCRDDRLHRHHGIRRRTPRPGFGANAGVLVGTPTH